MKKLIYHIRSLNFEDHRQLDNRPGFKERCHGAKFLQSRGRLEGEGDWSPEAGNQTTRELTEVGTKGHGGERGAAETRYLSVRICHVLMLRSALLCCIAIFTL